MVRIITLAGVVIVAALCFYIVYLMRKHEKCACNQSAEEQKAEYDNMVNDVANKVASKVQSFKLN